MKKFQLDEVALLQGLNCRDKHTINKLHGHIHKKFYWYAYDFLKDKAQAEDAITDAYLAIIKWEEAFVSLNNIEAWLYKRVRWICLDILKKRATHGNIEDLMEMPDDDNSVEERKTKAEFYHLALQAIENLPDRNKKLMKLYYLDEMSTRDIADELGMNVKTVHNTRKLILKAIRNELIRKSLTVLILGILLPLK
ncbi:hypothetical protein A4H97_31280 [Niastella yeongjuensis]|uniref:RNA polymerase subunit sigma-24 n=1 Tax=Niastella yeongjuensis TaxID=354355 RepID=A0A1V9EJE1_9BACT|nr:sigma-70 family RNA polymerase sigma factor [Niastella yeongjuensis]OQP46247.1 hypothetical protein A4H97_31280 [Niastella yeongjuensis]SEP46149.1 RNA polymerase sigma factor, sigma-70 family [Niastella yeongjuensis]